MAPATTPPSDQLCACTTLRKASRAVSRLYEDRFSATGLTITQFSILQALNRQPDQPLSRLAEVMVMDRTSLYRLIAPLVRDGLVSLQAGRGRNRIASKTAKGEATRVAARPVWESIQSQFLDQFGSEAWAALSAVLLQVVGLSTTEAAV